MSSLHIRPHMLGDSKQPLPRLINEHEGGYHCLEFLWQKEGFLSHIRAHRGRLLKPHNNCKLYGFNALLQRVYSEAICQNAGPEFCSSQAMLKSAALPLTKICQGKGASLLLAGVTYRQIQMVICIVSFAPLFQLLSL